LKDVIDRCERGEISIDQAKIELRDQYAGIRGSPSGDQFPDARLFDIDSLPNVEDIDEAPAEWLLEGIVEENTVNVLTGAGGEGKSLLSLGIGAAISRGIKFAELKTTQAHVLYIDRERQKLDHFRKRLRMMDATTGEAFKVWGRWISHGGPPLATDPSLLAWVKKHPRCLIIVDSQIAFLNGRKEESATDMRAFYDEWGELTKYGATILILHHVGKADGSISRGSSDIEAQDSLYFIERMNKGVRLEKLRITWQKGRTLLTEQLYLRFDDDGRGWSIDADAVQRDASRADRKQDQLLKLIQENPDISKKQFEDLAQAKGLGRDRARSFLDDGVSDKTILQTPGPKNSQLHTWTGGTGTGGKTWTGGTTGGAE
jgi:hypothetical protein